MTLINKCLSGITDHETYYQQTDSLKEQGIYDIIKRYISYQTIDLDLKRQLQIYEASMNHQIIDQRDKR
jgi:FH1/FH2 domain-containing protein 3